MPPSLCFFASASFVLAGVLATVPARAADAALKNGDFTAPDPAPWALWTGSAPISLQRDVATYLSAPAALRIEAGEGGYGAAYAVLPAAVRVGTVRGFARVAGAPQECLIAIQTFDAAKRRLAWITVAERLPVGEWAEFSESYSLPPEVAETHVTVTLRGPGTVWLDDLVLVPVETSGAAPSTATGTGTVQAAGAGGDRAALSPALAGWRSWIGKGALHLARDQGAGAAGERTALVASGDSAEAYGTAYLELPARPPGSSYRVRGRARVEGELREPAVALVFQDASRQQVGWVTLQTPGGAWQDFDQSAAVPAGASAVLVTLVVQGQGSLWVDGLTWE